MCIVRERRPAVFFRHEMSDLFCDDAQNWISSTGLPTQCKFVVTAQFCYPSHVPHVHLRFVASSHLREKDQ